MPINHVRSLLFWRRHRPQHLAAAAARGQHQECPICRGQHVVHVTGIVGGYTGEMTVDCACYAVQYETDLAVLAHALDRTPESLPTFETLAERRDCQDWTPALTALQDLARWPDHHTWVLLSGRPGTGKTHMLLATRARLPGLAAFVEASELSERLFAALKTQGFAELIDDLVAVPVLLLDDLGTEHAGADLITTAFSNILTRRFAAGLDRPTVISTNLQDDQLAARYPRVLDRSADRTLIEHFNFEMPSYRPLKGGGTPAAPASKYGYTPQETP